MNKLSSLMIAGLAALTMAGCAHNKSAPEPVAPPPPAKPAAASTPASNTPANTQGSGAGNGAALQSQAMGSDNGAGSKQPSSDQLALLKTGVIYFDYDSNDIHHSDYAALSAHASYLASNPAARLRLEGNADERGTREYNMALGERRAKAVAAFLLAHGAQQRQISVVSYGKEKPVANGHDEASWSRNRRVELHYTAGAP